MNPFPPLQADPDTPADILKGMAQADTAPLSDVLMRYAIVAAAGVSLYIATGQALMLWWMTAYLVTNAVYWIAITRPRVLVSRVLLWRFIAANICISSIFAAMPLWLWTHEEPAFRAIGLCGIIGHAVFNMTRHTQRSPIALWDGLSIVGCIVFVGLYEIFTNMSGPATQAVIAVGTLAVAVYYISGQRAMIRAREQLTQALEQSAHAGKMKAVGQLTAGISHDFNNLLTVIGGNIELAEITKDPEERAELLSLARDASDRAAQLTSQLLAFSRKAPLRAEDVDVSNFCNGLRATFARVLPASMQVSIRADDDLPKLRCDPTLLEAALLNLAINARDATSGRGTLALTFSLNTNISTVPMAQVSMRDNGGGIPADMITKVAEPFFTTKPVGAGSGLGLSMVSGFAEQSGGRMGLESGTNGTIVTLYLPLAAAEAVCTSALP